MSVWRGKSWRLLAVHPEIVIAGEARTGEEALELIGRLAPDVLFLDVRMPGMSGFELLQRLDDVPQVIFTTAYDEYALKAFEVNALDYLLKPVAPARLAAALARLRPRAAPSRLEQVEPGVSGNLMVTLRGGVTVEMSRRQSALFREALSL